MLREVLNFVLNGMVKTFNLTKELILDKVGSLNIRYFDFLVFIIFIAMALKVIEFIKGIQEIQTEKQENFNKEQKNAYNEWLRNHPSTPRRKKR